LSKSGDRLVRKEDERKRQDQETRKTTRSYAKVTGRLKRTKPETLGIRTLTTREKIKKMKQPNTCKYGKSRKKVWKKSTLEGCYGEERTLSQNQRGERTRVRLRQYFLRWVQARRTAKGSRTRRKQVDRTPPRPSPGQTRISCNLRTGKVPRRHSQREDEKGRYLGHPRGGRSP